LLRALGVATAATLASACIMHKGPGVASGKHGIAEVCSQAQAPATDYYGSSDFPSLTCRERANALLVTLSLRDKIAQMVQIGKDQVAHPNEVGTYGFGSVLSGGGAGPSDPNARAWAEMVATFQLSALKSKTKIPILYGVDAVHGHNNVRGATIFPHNIGLGATRDAALVERIGQITALEVKATNVDWTFAPVVAVTRDERWGRTYEAFGETPELAELLGPAYIRGLQGPRLGKHPTSVLACAKHFLGDGGTTRGDDQGDTDIDETELRRTLLPAYARSIEAGVGSIMVSFSSIRGVKMHCNGRLLTDVLKRELGFNGFLVSDWEAVDDIPAPREEQLIGAINAGLDLIMHPRTRTAVISELESLVPARIPMARIDDAVRRQLAIKCELGLLDPDHFQLTPTGELALPSELIAQVGSEAHRAVAREAVRKSIVILKNEGGLLPLKKDLPSLLIAGKNADNLGHQCGGWTVTWDGSSGPITEGTTIRAAIERSVSPKTRVTWSSGGRAAQNASVAIVVVGETPYVEGRGDREDLSLDQQDVSAIRSAKATGAKVVVVLVTGRPLILGKIAQIADAIVVAWLPGTEGLGVTDVLFGDVAASGKLPITWPKSMAQIPINFGDSSYEPLYPYGFGLSYAR
jgi:beta-glucosidase